MQTISLQRSPATSPKSTLTFGVGRKPTSDSFLSALLNDDEGEKDTFNPQHTATERQASQTTAETPATLPARTFVSTATQTEEMPPEATPAPPTQEPNAFKMVFQTVADIPPKTMPVQATDKARARTASARAEESSGDDESPAPKRPPTTKKLTHRKSLVIRGSSEEDEEVTPSTSNTKKQPAKPSASTAKKHPVAVKKTSSKLSTPKEKAYGNYLTAIETGELKEVRKALKEHPDFLDKPDDTNVRPLAVAASANQPAMVRFFLNKRGVNINAQDDAGYTAIMWPEPSSKSSSYIETLQVFMDYMEEHPGALDLSKKDQKGLRASSHAFSNSKSDNLGKRQKEQLKEIIAQMRAHETEHEK